MAVDDNGIMRLALTGKMRSGKSMLADHLWLFYDYTRLSFGEELKRLADDLFADSDAYKFEPKYEWDSLAGDLNEHGLPTGEYVQVGHKKPRKLYQDIGQKLRELDEDVWVRQVADGVKLYSEYRSTKGLVITDLRQPNEYEWARDNGFTIIRVNADEETRLQRANNAGDDFTTEDLRHDTEQHIDDFEVDYEIYNGEGTTEKAVKDEVNAIIRELREGAD